MRREVVGEAAHRRDQPRVQIPDLRRRIQRLDSPRERAQRLLELRDVALLQRRGRADRLPQLGADVVRELLELGLVLRLGQRLARLVVSAAAAAGQQGECDDENDGPPHCASLPQGDPTSRRAAQLLVEPDRLDAECLPCGHRVADVVAGLEHRQLVAGERRARQALDDRGARRARAGSARGPGRGASPDVRAIRSYSSFQVTRSGPTRSKVRFAAAGRSTAPAKCAATSSTQIGWSRRSPLPRTGVTGDQRTCRTKSGKPPPSRPKTKLGRKIDVLDARVADCLLHRPLRLVVRDERSRLLGDAERAHQHEPAHARGLCRGDQRSASLRSSPGRSPPGCR